MKSGIHPAYKQATVTCACGSVVVTRSTRGSFTTDVCSQCHPFYTGKHKIMDVAGRVDRFRRKYANNPKPAHAPRGLSIPASAPCGSGRGPRPDRLSELSLLLRAEPARARVAPCPRSLVPTSVARRSSRAS